MSISDHVTIETLAGVLARVTPRLYVVNTIAHDMTDSAAFWLAAALRKNHPHITVNETFFRRDPRALLRHFKSSIDGYVLYDPSNKNGSACAAPIRCAAASGGAVAVGEPATARFLDGMGIPMLFDTSAETPLHAFDQTRGASPAAWPCFNVTTDRRPLSWLHSPRLAVHPLWASQRAERTLRARSCPTLMPTRPCCRLPPWDGKIGTSISTSPAITVTVPWVHASDWATDVTVLSNLLAHSNAPRHEERRRSPPPRDVRATTARQRRVLP